LKIPSEGAYHVTSLSVILGGIVLSSLPIGAEVRGFKPGRGRLILNGDKRPQLAFLQSGGKAVGPMSLTLSSIIEIIHKAKLIISFASSSCFAARILCW
jgi:hypothetical protein